MIRTISLFIDFPSIVEGGGEEEVFRVRSRLIDDFNVENFASLLCCPSSLKTFSILFCRALSLTELFSLLSLSKSAADNEKTDTVLESVLRRSMGFSASIVAGGRGQTEDGTRTTEKIR